LKTPSEPIGSDGVTHYTFCESCVEYAIVENAYTAVYAMT